MDSAPRASVLRVGEYELGAELGRGAMGVVYRARQPRLRREVALKVILASRFAGETARKRFLAEAELAAQLDHPNIVPIYEVGETPDGPFYAMKLIEGGTLASVAASRQSAANQTSDGSAALSRDAATMIYKLARAVHHAHERGVLHRDLKPGNILLDAQGEPHIADFGVARQLGVASSLTLTGSTLGTPAYMAPEQAAGERGVTTAADTWSLGAILFHLLAGRPPFTGATATDVLLQVRTQEAPHLRSINPKIPADLETICLKCLEKNPARRYASARRLAEDLERWQRHEPIEARPVSSAERLVKWALRRPAVAALTVGCFIAALLGVVGITWQWRRAERHAEASRDRLVSMHRVNAQRSLNEDDPLGALPWLAAALASESPGSPRHSLARQNIAQVLRDAVIPEHIWLLPPFASGVQVSPNGTWAAAHEWGKFAQVWDIRTGKPLFPGDLLLASDCLLISPDSQRIAFGGDDGPRIYELPSGRRIKAPINYGVAVMAQAFSPDSRWLATGARDKTVRVWDATTGEPVTPLLSHRNEVISLAFSPDGSRLATVGHFGGLSVWEIASARELRRREGKFFAQVRFSPDGTRLLVAGGHNVPWVYRSDTLEPAGPPIASGDSLYSAVFSPDGLSALSEVKGGARVWDVSTGQPVTPVLIHDEPVGSLAFSPDGRAVATGGRESTARVWDATTGSPLTPWLRHSGGVNSLHFTPDSRHLLSGSEGAARLWPLQRNSTREFTLAGQTNEIAQVWASPDLPRLVTVDQNGGIRLWSAETGQPLTPECGDGTKWANIRISPDGTRLLAGGTRAVRIWNIATGAAGPEVKREIPGLGMEWHPRGESIFEGASTARITEWDAATGAKRRVLKEHDTKSPAIVSSTAAGLLAAPDGDKVTVWDPDSSDYRSSKSLPGVGFMEVRFSPNGRLLAARTDGLVAIFDMASLILKFDPLRHDSSIDHMEFSPDSRWLATAGHDGTARVWDTATGRLRLPPLRPSGGVNRVSFSPDNRLLGTTEKFTAQIWDLGTGLPVTLGCRFPQELAGSAKFAPDSRSVLFVTRDARVFRRELTVPDWPDEDWQFLAKLLSGQTVTESADLEPWRLDDRMIEPWNNLRERMMLLRETPSGNSASRLVELPRHSSARLPMNNLGP